MSTGTIIDHVDDGISTTLSNANTSTQFPRSTTDNGTNGAQASRYSFLPSGPLHRQTHNATVYRNCQYTINSFQQKGTILIDNPREPTSAHAAEEVTNAEGGIDVVWNPDKKEKRVFGGWSKKTIDPVDETTVTRIDSLGSPDPSVPGFGASFYTDIGSNTHLVVACGIHLEETGGSNTGVNTASYLLLSDPIQPFPIEGADDAPIINSRTFASGSGRVTEYGFSQSSVQNGNGREEGQSSQSRVHADVIAGLYDR
jgi:hypothetical protein